MRESLFLNSRAQIDDLKLRQPHELSSEMFESRADLIFTRRDDLGRCRRRGGANVGDEVGDREISFMAHGRDHWNRRLANRARDLFLVKCPEIFRRTAAATNNQNVDEIGLAPFAQRAFVKLVDETNRARDVGTGRIALHLAGENST